MLRERLAPYGLTTVLVAVSQVAGMVESWSNAVDFDADYKLIKEFLPTHRRAIDRFRTPNHVVFTRISLLYVSQQACDVCSDDTGSPVLLETSDCERIFETCLMANDLITQKRVLPEDTTIEKAVKLLPLANYVPHGTYPRDLARNLVILEQVAPLLLHSKQYRDLTSDFTKATGVSPQVFCQLAFAASAKYLAAKQHPESSFVLRLSNLSHESVPKEDIAAFFSKSSIRITDLLALARKQHAEPADFITFQRYPLIQCGPEAYVCPDPGFLLDKLGKSLYWTLHAAEPSEMRLGLLAYWSLLIERYVHWLCENIYRGKGRVLQSPRFADGAEVADIIIMEGSCLILVEVKGFLSQQCN